MRHFTFPVFVAIAVTFSIPAQAEIIQFRLTGNGGDGLLDSNVTPPTGSTGFGGEGLSGITFDTDTSILHVDVQWGSQNGFGDLTGDVTMLHWHGPTDDLPPDSFSQTGDLIINLALAAFDPAFDGGGVNGNYQVNDLDIAGLLQGRTYINVHTVAFDMGEIRGYLVQDVPEPGSAGLVALCLGGYLIRRRNR